MGPEETLNQCIPESQIAYGEGTMKKAAEKTFTITPAENNSEKADLLAKIDDVIKRGTDNLLRSIDLLAPTKKQICDLKQLRSEVESGRIGEGAKAVVEQALRHMW